MNFIRPALRLGMVLSVAWFSLGIATAADRVAPRRNFQVLPKAQALIADEDWLGFRIYVRKNFSRLSSPEEWFAVRDLIFQNADHTGYDLVYAWDKHPPGLYVTSGDLNVNESRFNADNLMMSGKFNEAFDIYQKIAIELRRVRKSTRNSQISHSVDLLYPYILHSMARALYGAARYDEAFIVLRWIHQTYPKFRQIQFEKMWSAFRGGRIDHALGAVASQHSAYFSRYLNSESYLVQIYLYKRLCRDQEYQQVLEEMRRFRKELVANTYTAKDWTDSDVETRILWNLGQTDTSKFGDSVISSGDRENEKVRIKQVLEKAFQSYRQRFVDDIDKALAYVQLAVRAGVAGGVLKPIEKLPDRQSLFKMDLEIWPADSAEEWIDEVGSHRFVGDSLCGGPKAK